MPFACRSANFLVGLAGGIRYFRLPGVYGLERCLLLIVSKSTEGVDGEPMTTTSHTKLMIVEPDDLQRMWVSC